MWKLEHLINQTGVFLQQGCELNVSRQDGCWLKLSEDASISRKHALLRVQHSPQAVKRNIPSTVELQDVNAKNGTYVKHGPAGDTPVEFTEADRLQTGTTVALNNGDIVRFGLYANCYRVVRCPLVVATSMLAAGDTEAVLTALLLLGATFSKDWTDQCTHLVMDSIKLSAKVTCALAYGAAIVTPEYLSALCSAVKNKESVLPPHTSYLPRITEQGIQQNPSLFERNVERRCVLSGLHFLFVSQRTSKRLSSIVLSAGGSCGVLSSRDHAALAAGQALLVRGMEDGAAIASQGSPFTAALGVVQKAGLKPVPESDIALAVLYCSTERFCNPALSQQHLVAPSVPQTQQESLIVFAPGTESFSASPSQSSRSSAATLTRNAVVTAHGSAAVVPDTPGSTAATASRRTDTAASTLSCRSTKAAPLPERNRTGETSEINEDGNQGVDVSALRGGVSMDATASLSLSSPSRPVDDSPYRSRLSRKRGRNSGSSASSAEEGAPATKRSTAATAIEPTQNIALSQDDDRTMPFGLFDNITGLEMSQFAPKDASTQKMEAEAFLRLKNAERVHVQTTVADAGNASGSTGKALAAQRATGRTKEVVTIIPPTPTPPLSHFPSSISVPPTPTPPPSHHSRNPIYPASPSRLVSAATGQTSRSLSPNKAMAEQRKQQQRRETITLGTLPSLPAETYADTSLFPGISDDPPPTLDQPSLPDGDWLPAARRLHAVVNNEKRDRRSLNRDDDISAILDPPPDSAEVNSRGGGLTNVERSESRDSNVFQMPTANVHRRKTKQMPAVPPAEADAITTVTMAPVGIKRTRSTEEREVMEQQAIEPTTRRIKYEPESQAANEPRVPPTPAAATQGFLSKPLRANGCNSTTLGLNCTSAVVTEASGAADAPYVSPSKAADAGNENVKPDPDVTRLSCAVLVSLVLRTSILGDHYCPPSNNTTVSGKRNFKLFKKVTHFSSDRPSQAVPRIIGGKDLMPHTAFYTETDADLRATARLESLRAEWLSQHPNASSYLDQDERDRQERLRDDWDDDRDQGSAGRGGGRGRGSSMMSYLITASSSSGNASVRSAPGPSTDASSLPVFRMPVAKVRTRQRR